MPAIYISPVKTGSVRVRACRNATYACACVEKLVIMKYKLYRPNLSIRFILRLRVCVSYNTEITFFEFEFEYSINTQLVFDLRRWQNYMWFVYHISTQDYGKQAIYILLNSIFLIRL